MTTSSLSTLSADAKEFVPSVSIPHLTTIPLYINESTVASVYSPQSLQQQLIYPLLKGPEIEFHIQSSQEFHIDSSHTNPPQSSITPNRSQIVLLPTNRCYPEAQILYPPNDQSSGFYPINYSFSQPKSNRISSHHQQRGGINHSNNHRHSNYDQQESTTLNSRRNFHSTNNKRILKRGVAHAIQQRDQSNNENIYHVNNDDTRFKFRSEDFPSLPINLKQESDQPVVQSLTPTNTKPTPSWNTIVSTPRPRSTSPHSVASSSKLSENQSTNRSRKKTINEERKSSNNNNNKPSVQSKSKTSNNNSKRNSSTEQQRSKSSTKNNESTKSPNGKPDEFIQTKQQKRAERRRQNKSKEISTPETIPFSLDDENAFPALGHEVPIQIAKKSENDSSTKNKPSIPGLINVSKIKAKQTYQICLTDMFNALNTSTQTKQDNSLNKTAKSSGKTLNSANPLDSNPVPKRGKEREQPKPRKPTKLKRIINKELEENQKQRQQFHVKSTAIKPTDEQDISCETDTNNVNGIDNFINDQSNDVVFPVNMNEYTSASCTDDSNDENDDDDDDEILDHEPTSQLQTPYAQQMPQSNIKQQIHDAGFREYCSQLIDRQLDELCIELLITLKRFQDRKKQQLQANPERARRKRRFVHGIREVTKHLRLQRLKCVLIAPDCQSIQSQGGLNDAIEKIINLCKEQNTPYIFTLNRQKLGRCLNKTSRISSIGIFDYSGADQVYKQIVDITCENQRAYKQIVDNILNHDESIATPSHGLNSREFYKILHRTFQQQQQPQLQKHHVVNIIPNESLSKVLPKVPAHYAHSRQTSDTSTIYIDPQLINSIIKQHTRASSGTFDVGKTATAATTKKHQRTLSDGATNVVNDIAIQTKHHLKTHSRTPSGCSVISQIEQQDYFEQSKNILMNSTNDICIENEENRLKSINEDTEENSANIKRKNVEKWINDN
ncbi:unnamed protein product [Rotaria magnacalcarata]|uniref:Ribosomal protein eL8/eL30/eS12/Gadd45 domain-containing protein n=1 Tax=Rotaria magnacalcarata TaxID=392030 RepID=A0A816S0X5_9BILA|nr:unnamed protein product [Rotaria magnacalcarata]